MAKEPKVHGRKSQPVKIPTPSQIWNDLKSLAARVEQLSSTVSKLKDLLNVQDNWHSRVSPLIGKYVFFVSTSCYEVYEDHGAAIRRVKPERALLVYADRYTIGLKFDNNPVRLYNKGQIEYIQAASE